MKTETETEKEIKQPKWGDFINSNGKIIKYFPLHEAQQKILSSKKRFRLFLGGVGSGKTSCGAIDLLHHVQANPKGTFLVVAPTTKILDSATIPTWFKTVEGTQFKGTHKVQRQQIELATGGIIYVRSCFDSNGGYTGSFEGIQANYCWIDEAGQLSRKAWEAVLRRCASQNASIFLSSTPYTFNWLKNDFYARAINGDDNYEVVTCKSIDNPGFSKDAFELAKETSREHQFKMFYCAEWSKAAGLVFPDVSDYIVDEIPDGLTGRWVGGIDFGFNDPFAAIVGVIDDDETLWLVWERYEKHKDIMEHGEALSKLPVNNENIRWWCDSANPDNIKLLRRKFGLNARAVKKGAGSISYGLNLMHHLGKSGKLKILRDGCPNLISEAETYSYSETDGELIDKIKDGQPDHGIDSTRYAILGEFRKIERK